MNPVRVVCLAVLLVAAVLPGADGAVQLNQQFSCDGGEVYSIQQPQVLGLINAGQTVLCVSTTAGQVARVGSTYAVSVKAFGPTLLSLTVQAAGALIAGAGASGCTFTNVGPATIPTNQRGAPGLSGQDVGLPALSADVILDQWGTITVTGADCSVPIRAYACISTAPVDTACQSGTLLYNVVFTVNIHTGDTVSQVAMHDCNATGGAESAITRATTCTTPAMTVDSLTRICAASSLGSSCTQPTFSMAQSGAWSMTLSGIPDTQQEIQAIADALAAGIEVNVCPQTAPCYHVLSGAVDTGSTNITTGDVIVPDTFHLCGPEITPGDCQPVEANGHFPGTITAPNFDWWAEIVFWVIIFWYCFTRKNLFMLAFALGGVWHLFNPHWVFGLEKSIPWMLVGGLLDGFIHYKAEQREQRKSKTTLS